MALTKTNFMRGMQCPKMLWLDRHRPSLMIIPPEIQARLDAGNEFGDRAMGMFGPYEEMTVYRSGTTIPDKKAMLANTEDALSRGVGDVLQRIPAQEFNRYVDDYNEKLRTAVNDSPLLQQNAEYFTTVPEITGGSTGFNEDGLHYSDDTLKEIVDYILEH